MPTLNWIGKEKVINHHLDVPYRILEHKYHFSAENGKQSGMPAEALAKEGNKIIHGDNLEALKSLLPQYEGKVDTVYIDPPYNTGKEKWRYTDNVNHPKIQKWLDEIVGQEGEDLTRHDKWLCMMYPRIKLLHKLLKDNGVFYCSIDDYEQGNLKPMLDSIFGHQNFLNNVIWQRAYAPINTKKRFSANHDFIVCYAKNKSKVELLLPRTEDANSKYGNIDHDPRGIWRTDNFTVGPRVEENVYEIITPSGRKCFPPPGRSWLLSQVRFKEAIKDNRIWFGKNGSNIPATKRFFHEVKAGITPMTVWPYAEVGHTQDAKREIKELFPLSKLPFETPKPTKLMEKILSLKNNPDAIVLDSFAGTGSTAHAVLKLNKNDGGNRKFILVELEDYAEKLTATRVKKAIQGYEYTGKKKSILSSYTINITNLKKADKILEELEIFQKDDKYSQVKIEEENRNITITGEENIVGKVEGLGGSFDYYELGKPLFLENEMLNEEVGLEKIREYVWYTETRQPYAENTNTEEHLLGTTSTTAYYFYYYKNELTTLDDTFMRTIKIKSEQYIIYADNCLLTKDFMQKYHIIFKKIPRDITRF